MPGGTLCFLLEGLCEKDGTCIWHFCRFEPTGKWCIVSEDLEKDVDMTEPQILVRSAKVHDIANRLARRENRSITDVIERALESYDVRGAAREPAAAFYARLSEQSGTDIDLEEIVQEGRLVHQGVEL
jgi:hypothetical protein